MLTVDLRKVSSQKILATSSLSGASRRDNFFFWLQHYFVLMVSEYFFDWNIFFLMRLPMFEAQAWFQHGSSMPMLEFHGCVVGHKLTSVSSIYIYIILYIYISLSLSLSLMACLIGHQPDSEFCSTCLSLRCVYDNAHATSQCVTEIQNIKDLKNR